MTVMPKIGIAALPRAKASRSAPSQEAWLVYAVKTARLVQFDPAVYPSVHRPASGPGLAQYMPKPEWVCQAPHGGLHVHASAQRIDVHIAEQPVSRLELNTVRGYDLNLIKTKWLDLILDLINPERVFVRAVIFKGKILPDWRTIRSLAQPLLCCKREDRPVCPNCGYQTSFPKSRPWYFSDPQIAGEPVLATGNGTFVRKDLALARNLRRPRGAFKPMSVVLRPADTTKPYAPPKRPRSA
jgi:hypothetical protein